MKTAKNINFQLDALCYKIMFDVIRFLLASTISLYSDRDSTYFFEDDRVHNIIILSMSILNVLGWKMPGVCERWDRVRMNPMFAVHFAQLYIKQCKLDFYCENVREFADPKEPASTFR